MVLAHHRRRAIADRKAGGAIGPAESYNLGGTHVEAGEPVGIGGVPMPVTETGDQVNGCVSSAHWVQGLEFG